MAIWTVWEHERHGLKRADRARFVKDGFSWWALLFGPLWLLFNRMWVVFVAYLVVMIGLSLLIGETMGEDVAGIVGLGLQIWFAFEARGLKRWTLARRGWTMMGVVEARRFRNAERRYFTERPALRAPLAPTDWLVGDAEVLGVFPEAAR